MQMFFLLACQVAQQAMLFQDVPPGTTISMGPSANIPKAGPNLLLISIDALRADHLGIYGYHRPTTPNIDAIAARGVRGLKVISPRGATWPALTSLWTSLPPVLHGVRRNFQASSTHTISLSEQLQMHGYTTTAFLTNAVEEEWKGFNEITGFPKETHDADAVEAAGAYLATAQGPFCVWVHLMAPHDPYVSHPGYPDFKDPSYQGPISDAQGPLIKGMFAQPAFTPADKEAIIARYDGEVVYADTMVGRLMTALVQSGHRADTLVVLTADHGEELLDHPPFLFHFASIYNGVLQVPLILSQPGVLPEAQSMALPVSLLDLAPTLTEFLGVPPANLWLGRSVAAEFMGHTLPEKPLFAEMEERGLVMYQGNTVYFSNPSQYAPVLAPPVQLREAGMDERMPNNAYPLPIEALWDLSNDPLQQHPQNTPEALANARVQVEAFKSATGWPGVYNGHAPEVSVELREKLERMGYLAPGDPR